MRLMAALSVGLRERRLKLGLSQAKFSELTGVPQHLLSAVELGRLRPDELLLDAVAAATVDEARVAALAARRKRYQHHQFCVVAPSPERIRRACVTDGNADYRSELATLADRARAPRDASMPTALSLFAGCGGLSLGAAAAGFAVRGFVEIDPALRRIYAANFPEARSWGDDVASFADAALAGIGHAIGPIDLLIGGPPCQGFSLSGKRAADDPRNALFREYMRFVACLRPKVTILENVRVLTSMKTSSGTSVKEDILRAFRQHGYAAGAFDVNAVDFGVPQHRERVIFVAVRRDLDVPPSIPVPTHRREPVDSTLFADLPRHRSFADGCSDLPYLESGGTAPTDLLHAAVRHPQHVIDWLWDVPEGRSAHENDDPAKRPPSGYNTTYKRQVWNRPAATVQTTFGMISGCRNVHPIATRSLTIREAARLQSFPDTYALVGSQGTLRKGIGNAVPPLMAYALAAHVRDAVCRCRK